MPVRIAAPSGTLDMRFIPPELREHILSFLSISDLISCSIVNKGWQKSVYGMKIVFWYDKFTAEQRALLLSNTPSSKRDIFFLLNSVLFPTVDARVRATTNVRDVITTEIYGNMHAFVFATTRGGTSVRMNDVMYECAHLICKRLCAYLPNVDRKVLARITSNIFARVDQNETSYRLDRDYVPKMYLSESLLRPHAYLRKCHRRLVRYPLVCT
jgi:hypothetical protein